MLCIVIAVGAVPVQAGEVDAKKAPTKNAASKETPPGPPTHSAKISKTKSSPSEIPPGSPGHASKTSNDKLATKTLPPGPPCKSNSTSKTSKCGTNNSIIFVGGKNTGKGT